MSEAIFIFKVALQVRKGTWRRIAVKGSQTLDDLHEAVFDAFDREDEHLYSFYFPRPGTRGLARVRNAIEYSHPYTCTESGPLRGEAPGNAGCFGCFTSVAVWLLFLGLVFFGFILHATLPQWLIWTLLILIFFVLILFAVKLSRGRGVVALLVGLLVMGALMFLWMTQAHGGGSSAEAATIALSSPKECPAT